MSSTAELFHDPVHGLSLSLSLSLCVCVCVLLRQEDKCLTARVYSADHVTLAAAAADLG